MAVDIQQQSQRDPDVDGQTPAGQDRGEPAAATIGSAEGGSMFEALSDDEESKRALAFIEEQRVEIQKRAERLAAVRESGTAASSR